MEVKTTVAESIDAVAEKVQYDAACKRVLSEKIILAWIMKHCMDEYKECDVNQIAAKYIVGEPVVSKVAVAPDETNADGRIRGIGTEETTLTEGTSYYDIRFYALIPDIEEQVELIINVEAQDTDHPGYPLTMRGIYYGCRTVTSQYGVEFTNAEYGKIKKVYSIWICMNPADKRKNAIVCYELKERSLAGNVQEKPSHYDLLSVVMVYLGEERSATNNKLLRMLNVLLGTESDAAYKKAYLQNEFAIPMTKHFEQEVSEMCNLSQGVEQRGIEKGKVIAIAEMVRDGILTQADGAKRVGLSTVDFRTKAKELGYTLYNNSPQGI